MPCHARMRTINLRGLLWLYLLGFAFTTAVEPGFLDFDNLPDTNFSCVGKVIGGYYADLETNCQMFHVCTIGQLDEPMDIRFLCLNGTVFDQETRVCERIDEVDCSKSEQFYSLNLELYGNTQPSITDDAETDPPIIIKASTTTTTTTTSKPTTKSSRAPVYTTSQPTITTVTKVISAHHFPISGTDIRFNPEEINISLNPGASPSIRSKTVAYQQQVFANNNDKKVVVTTHTSYGDDKDFVRVVPNTRSTPSTPKTKPPATPSDINYGFTYDYTEQPHNYQYHHSNVPLFRQFRNHFKTTTHRVETLPTTRKFKEPTTFVSIKAPTYYTEKPQRLQLPLPLLPTLPPLTFSSPAPFTLQHVDAKRYTSDQPPRIIISASASVSDNSGRRLNYSLGTIGVAPLLEEPPKSYDEYKDHDVSLDPFYHDVPKIRKSRRKRQLKPSDVNSEQAAIDVLKFLFDWYSSQKSTVKVPINPEDITEINEKLAPVVEAPDFKKSELFKRSKFNIVGDVLSVTEVPEVTTVPPTPVTVAKLDTVDYVDDNYEAKITTEVPTTTTEVPTEPPTTTTTEPTTTSRIMGIMKKRARAHHKRIMTENKKRYDSFLTNLKPKIRRRGRTSTNAPNLATTETTSAKTVVTTEREVSTEKAIVRRQKKPTGRVATAKSETTERVKELSTERVTARSDQESTERVTTVRSETTPVIEIETTTERVVPTLSTEKEPTTTETVITTLKVEELTEMSGVEVTTEMLATTAAPEVTTVEYLEGTTIEPETEEAAPFEEEDQLKQETKFSENIDLRVENLNETSTEKEEEVVESPEKPDFEERIDLEEPETTTEYREETTTELEIETESTTSESTTLEETTLANEAEEANEEQLEKESSSETSDEPKIEEPVTEASTIENLEEPVENSIEDDSIGTTTEPTEFETTEANTQPSTEPVISTLIPTEGTTVEVEITTVGPTSTTTSFTTTTTVEPTSSTTTSTTTTVEPTSSTTSFTPTSRRRRPSLRHRFSSNYVTKPSRRKFPSTSPVPTSTLIDFSEDVPSTDAPLFKSANPTTAHEAKEALHTTPLSYKFHVRKGKLRPFIFNCFGKTINKFYSDPRDCRLFHYCTSGYTKNQLLDMKFVCDLGTYFDEEKLICTKTKPERCL